MSASLRSVRLDRAATDRLLREPRGEVGRHLSRLGGFVTREAKSLADQRLKTRSPGGYASRFRTTTLRAGGELRTRISNDDPKATWIENGTRPHTIVPRRASVLVFTGSSGSLVFTRHVNHPGTRPQRILTDALRLGMARAR